MATITKPPILDETGVAIKNSIDLLTANINRTADNIAYDSNLTIKGKIQAIDLTSGGNITGDLTVDRKDGTTAERGYGLLVIGNNKPEGTAENTRGLLDLYGTTAYRARLVAGALTGNRQIEFPDKTGTVATREEIMTGTTSIESGTYSITYSGSTFSLTGVKININPNRYTIIGVVLSGSTYTNKMFMYSSWDGNAYLLN